MSLIIIPNWKKRQHNIQLFSIFLLDYIHKSLLGLVSNSIRELAEIKGMNMSTTHEKYTYRHIFPIFFVRELELYINEVIISLSNTYWYYHVCIREYKVILYRKNKYINVQQHSDHRDIEKP